MSSLNKVQIIGRLGNDPEVRYMPNGDAVANLSVATSERWKDKQTNEMKEATEWHKVTMYRRQAEVAGEYLKKGSLAYFEGSLRTRKWQDQQGNDRYTTEIISDKMKMLDSRQDGQQAPKQHQQTTSRPQQNGQQKPAMKEPDFDFDDDIPF